MSSKRFCLMGWQTESFGCVPRCRDALGRRLLRCDLGGCWFSKQVPCHVMTLVTCHSLIRPGLWLWWRKYRRDKGTTKMTKKYYKRKGRLWTCPLHSKPVKVLSPRRALATGPSSLGSWLVLWDKTSYDANTAAGTIVFSFTVSCKYMECAHRLTGQLIK